MVDASGVVEIKNKFYLINKRESIYG